MTAFIDGDEADKAGDKGFRDSVFIEACYMVAGDDSRMVEHDFAVDGDDVPMTDGFVETKFGILHHEVFSFEVKLSELLATEKFLASTFEKF